MQDPVKNKNIKNIIKISILKLLKTIVKVVELNANIFNIKWT